MSVLKPQIVRQSKYRHIKTELYRKASAVEDAKASITICTSSIRSNSNYFAIPWQNQGKVAVWPCDKPGRMVNNIMFAENGSEVTDFDISPFSNILVTGGDDGKIKVWEMEGETIKKINEKPIHPRRICTLDFHPTIQNLIITSGSDGTIKLTDINTMEVLETIQGHKEIIINVSFNYDGTLMATASKDKKARIVDLKEGKIINEFNVVQDSGKGFRVCWAGKRNNLITVGFTRGAQRSVSIYDVNDTSKPLQSITIDNELSILQPCYDADLDILICFARGEASVRTYEVTDEKPYIHVLNVSSLPDKVYGFSQYHKTKVNVMATEIDKFLLLTGEPPKTVICMGMKVPRVRSEYFQDDIFPDTKSFEPLYTYEELKSGEKKEPTFVSLQPEGIKKVSEVPNENTQAKYNYEKELQRRKEEEERRYNDALFERAMEKMAELHPDDEKQDEDSSGEWSLE